MSQTDKLISLTGLSRILNVIKEFVNNRIINASKKIKRVTPTVSVVEGLEVGSIILKPNEYIIIDDIYDIDKLQILIPDAQPGTTLSYSSNDYACQFTIPSNKSVKISFPSNFTKWRNGLIPTFNTSKTYVVSIVNNLGTISEYSLIQVSEDDDYVTQG